MSRSTILGALVLPLLLLACTSAPPKGPATPPPPKDERAQLPVIDTHTHTRFDGKPERSSHLPVTREEYMREREEAGVVATISHVSGTGNGYNADMKAKNVFHCYGIGEKVNLVGLENGLKSKDYRCVKIYLGYIPRYAYEAPYRAVYKIAEKYDVPVVFHTGDTYAKDGKLKYSDPLTIDEVAVDFPKVTFVIAHLGNPWIQSAAEVAYKNSNVYVEASALWIGDFSKSDPADIEEYMIKPIRWAIGYMEDPSKLMYGTDWPLTGMKDYLEAYKRAVPRDQWCQVFFETPVKVFHLKEIGEKYKCTIK